MSPKAHLVAVSAAAICATFIPEHADASSIAYSLTDPNTAALADGVDYLRVTISDDVFGSDPNAIRFDVELLAALTGIADDNFGLQSFGFNAGFGTSTVINAITGLPDGWTIRADANQSGFGRFEVLVRGTGATRVTPLLSFYISGIDGDVPDHYALLSTGNAELGNTMFAGHVAGFLDQDPGNGTLTSAYFGGSLSVVPVPASAWLFTSAVGLLGWTRRRRTRGELP